MAQVDMILHAVEGITGSRAACKLDRLVFGYIKVKSCEENVLGCIDASWCNEIST